MAHGGVWGCKGRCGVVSPGCGEDLATVGATLAAGQTPFFTTTSLLEDPGAIISVRVYAITGDDQESFSDEFTVQRPAAQGAGLPG